MYQRILVAIDGSVCAHRALETALPLATLSAGQIRLVHMLDELDYVSGYRSAPEVIDRVRVHARQVLESAKQTVMARNIAADACLIEAAGQRLGDAIAVQARTWNADLVVAGTHGRRGIPGTALGSGAEQIVRASPVPVLVVRSQDADRR